MLNETLRPLRHIVTLPYRPVSSQLLPFLTQGRTIAMSRKPPTSITGRTGMSRTTSAAALTNMPPPSKIPNRPPSVMSTSSTSSKLHNGNEPPSRPHSPPRDPGTMKPRRTMANGNVVPGGRARPASSEKGGLLSDESGEMNIQVVVRCR